jgi:hypothetical protein
LAIVAQLAVNACAARDDETKAVKDGRTLLFLWEAQYPLPVTAEALEIVGTNLQRFRDDWQGVVRLWRRAMTGEFRRVPSYISERTDFSNPFVNPRFEGKSHGVEDLVESGNPEINCVGAVKGPIV